MEKDWVKLASFNDLQRAEILKNLLWSEGIEAVLINKMDRAYISVGQAELYCHAKHALKALEILETNYPL